MNKFKPASLTIEEWLRMSEYEKYESIQATIYYANTARECYEKLADAFDKKHPRPPRKKSFMDYYGMCVGIVIGGVAANGFIYVMNILKEV